MDAQPDKVRDICLYRFYLMMLEAGWMKMVRTLPGDDGVICVFGMAVEDTFLDNKPNISPEFEQALISGFREILIEEDFLDGDWRPSSKR